MRPSQNRSAIRAEGGGAGPRLASDGLFAPFSRCFFSRILFVPLEVLGRGPGLPFGFAAKGPYRLLFGRRAGQLRPEAQTSNVFGGRAGRWIPTRSVSPGVEKGCDRVYFDRTSKAKPPPAGPRPSTTSDNAGSKTGPLARGPQHSRRVLLSGPKGEGPFLGRGGPTFDAEARDQGGPPAKSCRRAPRFCPPWGGLARTKTPGRNSGRRFQPGRVSILPGGERAQGCETAQGRWA